MKMLVNVLIIAALALVGSVTGATAHGVSTLLTGEVRHLVFEAKYSDGSAPVVYEQWLDESRSLAREVQVSTEGPVVNATGPDWWLHVPSFGAAQLHETHAPGAPMTRSIFWRLFYLREGLEAGRAQVSYRSDAETVISEGRRRASYDQATGLPRWEDFGDVRVDYKYLVNERLPSRDYPLSFFSAGLEAVGTVSRSVPMSERSDTQFNLAMTLTTVAGRTWTATVITDRPSELVQQQVISYYGTDLVVEEALLAEAPAEVRPDGVLVETSIGPGLLFQEGDRWHLMVLRGRMVVNVHGPDSATVRSVGFALR